MQRQERWRKEEEERQKEEQDFCRLWREPIELLGKAMGKNRKAAACGAMPAMRAWMHEIRETLYDFSQIVEEDALSRHYSDVLQAQEQVLSTGFAALSIENGVAGVAGLPLDGIGRAAVDRAAWTHLEGDERNMERDSASFGNSVTGNMVENGLPGGMSDEKRLWANSDNQESNVTLWYTDQVRKWYRYADVC